MPKKSGSPVLEESSSSVEDSVDLIDHGKAQAKSKSKTLTPDEKLKELDDRIESAAEQLAKNFECAHYCLLDDISPALVDEVFEHLREKFPKGCENLLVVLSSGGGDIDAAFNLAKLFRRYGKTKLLFAIPRWAKSAATLLACGGDEILMTPIAELGPLDPQITTMNTIEQRMEKFSPLHIRSTLELIGEQFEGGKSELAKSLLGRLQFPLTLGSFKKSLEIGKQYLSKLLSRMLGTEENGSIARIAETLVEGFADHGACILSDEALEMGLKVVELESNNLDLAWLIHRLEKEKNSIVAAEEKKKLKERINELSPETLEKLGL